MAEYVAVEARNLAPLPGDVDFTVGASMVMSGLTAWQGLVVHGRLQAGQTVRTRSSTSRTTFSKMSAGSIWFLTALAATSRSGPQA
jgi:hypothetical protein